MRKFVTGSLIALTLGVSSVPAVAETRPQATRFSTPIAAEESEQLVGIPLFLAFGFLGISGLFLALSGNSPKD